MGSEGPKAVTIHVTGFKKFQGVAENPTETIVNNLMSFVQRKGLLLAGVTLGSCTVLELQAMVLFPCFTRSWNQVSQEQVICVSFYYAAFYVFKVTHLWWICLFTNAISHNFTSNHTYCHCFFSCL
ncbi:hypothetical protein PTKIN_Ptkin02bG0083900 [Pterospermum kingtungense]